MPQTPNKWNFYVSIIYKKNTKFVAIRCVFFQAENAPNVFGRGSAPDPAGGAYDALPDPLVGWGGGNPLPILLPLDAFGVSISDSCPPNEKIVPAPLTSPTKYGSDRSTCTWVVWAHA